MLKNLLLRSFIALLSIFAANAVHATLVGDTVTGSLTNKYPSWTSVPTPMNPSAVVGSGTEFNGQWKYEVPDFFSFVWDVSVDLGATSFTVSIHDKNNPGANVYAYDSPLFAIDLGSLNLGSPITGVNLTSGTSQFGNLTFVSWDFTADSIALTWYDIPSPSQSYGTGFWTFDIVTGNDSAGATVPEPDTLVLMGLALLSLGVLRSRQKKAA